MDKLNEKDAVFIMELCAGVQDAIFTRLDKEYEGEKKGKLLHVFLTNFVCNTLSCLSDPVDFKNNIKNFISTVQKCSDLFDQSELTNQHKNEDTN